jgi:hypothetical protein
MSASWGQGRPGISIAHELQRTDIGVWLLESGGRDVERRAQRLNRAKASAIRSTGSTSHGSGRSVGRASTVDTEWRQLGGSSGRRT